MVVAEMMRRTPMKRTPMKRAPWPQREYVAAPPPPPTRGRLVQMARCDDGAVPVEKERAIVSEPYRRLVAALPCMVCGMAGISQAAHPNTGKGAGIKTDDRLCFPLCCDQPGRQGCHPKFDQHALYTRDQRRELEPAWGAQTRAQILAAGTWPPRLPLFVESEQ